MVNRLGVVVRARTIENFSREPDVKSLLPKT